MSHILQLTILRYPEILGGVDAVVVNLVTHLRAHHQVSVFVPGGWEQKALTRRTCDGVDVYSIRLRLPFLQRRSFAAFFGWLVEFPRTLLRLRSLMREQGIDIIHAHMGKDYHMYLRVLRWIGGPPYIITLHRGEVVDYLALSTTSRWLLKFALHGAAGVNAVSRWLAQEAEKLFPRIAPVPWIYNGLEIPAPVLFATPYAGQLPQPFPQRYVVMVGSFDPYKGHDIALRAWGLLREMGIDLPLLVLGDGDLRPQYEALIEQMGCQATVHLLGQVSHNDVLKLTHRAMAMVFPSRNEGLGYVLLEAGAVGTAVVCTQIPPFAELIENDVNGLMVPVEDPSALAGAITRLAGDPQLCDRLGKRLQQQVHARFTAEVMTHNYEQLYGRCLESGS